MTKNKFMKIFKWSTIVLLTGSVTFSTVVLDQFGPTELIHLSAVFAILFGDL